MILASVIAPILFVVLLGFILRRFGRLDEQAFSRAQLYVLSPALVFVAMARAEADIDLVLKLLLYVVVLSSFVLAVSQGAAFAARTNKSERYAVSLVSTFMNSGFYGIPVCLLAFGEIGLIYATVFVAASSIVQSTLGVFIANAGSERPLKAFLAIFKVPLIHAIVLSRLLVYFNALPPEPLMKMINLLGQAAIPLGLLLLGMQIERLAFKERAAGEPVGEETSCEEQESETGRRDIALGMTGGALRIVCGFVFAMLIVRFFDFEPGLEKVVIVQSSMPTAVNTIVYATEFRCMPKLVATGILFSTLLSIASLTLILTYVV